MPLIIVPDTFMHNLNYYNIIIGECIDTNQSLMQICATPFNFKVNYNIVFNIKFYVSIKDTYEEETKTIGNTILRVQNL